MLLLLLKLYVKVEAEFPGLKMWDATILIVLLLIMFLASYRKQTRYITERIESNPGGLKLPRWRNPMNSNSNSLAARLRR